MIDNKKIGFALVCLCLMLAVSVSCGGNKKTADAPAKPVETVKVEEAAKPAEVKTSAEPVVTAKSAEVVEPVVAEAKEEKKEVVAEQEPDKSVVMFLVAETKEADLAAEKAAREAALAAAKAAAKAQRDAEKAARDAENARKAAETKKESNKFLDKFAISAYASPFALRNFEFTEELDTIRSKYGTGAKIKGRYELSKGFYAAVDIDAITAFMKKEDSDTNFTDIAFIAKLGYKYDFRTIAKDKLYAFVETGCGVEITAANNVGRAYYVLAMELGFGYKLNDNWSLETSFEGTWHYGKCKALDSDFSAWGFNTFLGATYKF